MLSSQDAMPVLHRIAVGDAQGSRDLVSVPLEVPSPLVIVDFHVVLTEGSRGGGRGHCLSWSRRCFRSGGVRGRWQHVPGIRVQEANHQPKVCVFPFLGHLSISSGAGLVWSMPVRALRAFMCYRSQRAVATVLAANIWPAHTNQHSRPAQIWIALRPVPTDIPSRYTGTGNSIRRFLAARLTPGKSGLTGEALNGRNIT